MFNGCGIFKILNLAAIDSTKIAAVALLLIILVGLLILQNFVRIKFRERQMEYSRVKEAQAEKEELMKEIFSSRSVNYPPSSIFIRIFKEEGIVELWANSSKNSPFNFIKNYSISKSSGTAGPKRQEGDRQVPEGFYFIERFNPQSKYYLSLGINYPNESDSMLGDRNNPGGDIFIHGGNHSVGCIPITDDGIKELYLVAVEAVSAGQDRIPVHIFPKKMDSSRFNDLKERYKENRELISFWENLKEGYNIFENNGKLPHIVVGRSGRYIFR